MKLLNPPPKVGNGNLQESALWQEWDIGSILAEEDGKAYNIYKCEALKVEIFIHVPRATKLFYFASGSIDRHNKLWSETKLISASGLTTGAAGKKFCLGNDFC